MRHWFARWWAGVLAAAAVLLTGVVVGPAATTGDPLDPRSTDVDGARAAVEVLEALGRTVEVASEPRPDTATFVVLADRLGERQRDAVRGWVEAGGRLIVADPTSPLNGPVEVVGRLPSDTIGPTDVAPDCDLSELADVTSVRSATWFALDNDVTTARCFPVAGAAWLVRRPVAAGEVISLGGADAFTNARLDEADNALLLVRLSAGGPIVLADAAPPGSGEATLAELVPDRVYLALALLVLAFVLVAWAHGRRLGAPVEEVAAVRIPSSELVIATGELMQRAGVRDAAADVLRADLRREAAVRLGLPLDAPVDVLAERLASWTGGDAAGIARALAPDAPPDDEALVRLARSLARLRQRLGSRA